MMSKCKIAALAYTCIITLMVVDRCAAQQQAQPDPKYLLGPLQAQRDQNANQAALCSGDNARLNEEIAALKAKLAEAEAKMTK